MTTELTKACPYCKQQVFSRADCLAEHFAFYAKGNLKFWAGNIRMFGLFGGLLESVCLSFPFINALVNWRYRDARLSIDLSND